MQHVRITLTNWGRWGGRVVDLDLAALGTGIIRIAGPNESGKSTLFDALNPYNAPLRRADLRTYACPGTSSIEHVFDHGGHRYRRVYAQRFRTKSGRWPTPQVELHKDGEQVATGAKEYATAIREALGPPEQFYALAIQGQKSMRNSAKVGDFVDADPTDREAMFKRFLHLDDYEAARRRVLAWREGAREQRDRLRPYREQAETLDGDLALKRGDVAECEGDLEEARSVAAEAGRQYDAAVAALQKTREQAAEAERVAAALAALDAEQTAREQAEADVDAAAKAREAAEAGEAKAAATLREAERRLRDCELAASDAVQAEQRRTEARARVERSQAARDEAKREADAAVANRDRLTAAHEAGAQKRQHADVAVADAEAAEARAKANADTGRASRDKCEQKAERMRAEAEQKAREADEADEAARGLREARSEAHRRLDRAAGELDVAKAAALGLQGTPFGDKCAEAGCRFVAEAVAARSRLPELRAAVEAITAEIRDIGARADARTEGATEAKREAREAAEAAEAARGAYVIARGAAVAAERAAAEAVAATAKAREEREAVLRSIPAFAECVHATGIADEAAKRLDRAESNLTADSDALAALPDPDTGTLATVEEAREAVAAAQTASEIAQAAARAARAQATRREHALSTMREPDAIQAEREGLPALAPPDVEAAEQRATDAKAARDIAREAERKVQVELAELRGAVSTLESQAAGLQARLAELDAAETAARRSEWLQGELDRLIRLLVELSGPAVADKVNELLRVAYGSRFVVRLEPETKHATTEGVKRTYHVWITDTDPPFAKAAAGEQLLEEFSGAAQNMLGQAILMGLRLFAAERLTAPINTVMLDEADAAMDRDTKAQWQQMLRAYRTLADPRMSIWIVTHAEGGIDCDNELDLGQIRGVAVDASP